MLKVVECSVLINVYIVSGDQISKDLIAYVEGETLNPSAKKYFAEFAHELAAIQDYRNAQVLPYWEGFVDLFLLISATRTFELCQTF
jgi:hypothetical protein